MRIYDLIEKKKRGSALSDEEIRYLIAGFVSGEIPDYQMSAMLMAIWFNGMDDREITTMTIAMEHSGETADLSGIDGFKVDKHSTGGVGDKTTLIVGPIAAACGVRVAKMSGRGLGFTGGTIDKLEAIPGFRTSIPREEFFRLVSENGIAVIGQSGNLVPADKKIYALRDVTATVDSIPLIASSIMSKKLAGGSDGIVLDVKTGGGAFMKTLDNAVRLAEQMVKIGTEAGRAVTALITNMDSPIGYGIGNEIEVRESIDVLKGNGPEDLKELSILLAAQMLCTAGKGSQSECRQMAEEALESGRALKVFRTMVIAQGGDGAWLDEVIEGRKPLDAPSRPIRAEKDGYIGKMDTEGVGIASMMLHAGRKTSDDVIDPSAGIILRKKQGDPVRKGDVTAVMYARDESLFDEAEKQFAASCPILGTCEKPEKMVFARADASGVTYL
ncbi:thymidine phosphorylase [[Clostridium] aminophilum]|uniref:thymidine phosphorylase n=1 Tax=[Clostridium] aminophilum TaxID=1526 RepID=UPI00331D77AE